MSLTTSGENLKWRASHWMKSIMLGTTEVGLCGRLSSPSLPCCRLHYSPQPSSSPCTEVTLPAAEGGAQGWLCSPETTFERVSGSQRGKLPTFFFAERGCSLALSLPLTLVPFHQNLFIFLNHSNTISAANCSPTILSRSANKAIIQVLFGITRMLGL